VKGSFSGFDPAIPLKIECTLLGVENENIISEYNYICQVIEVQENGTFSGKVADLIDQELPEPNDLTKLVYHAALRFTKDCLYSSVTPPILNILKSKTLPVNSLSSANMVLQPQTWILSSPATSDGKILMGRSELITIDELKGIIPKAKMDNIIKYYPHINDTLKEFEINTKLRIAYFLCHVPVETGSLDLLEQNTRSSSQYIGRGIIQLTGECNYKAFSEFLKRPEILTNPGCVASDPTLTCRSAGWWWRFSDKNDANWLADKEEARQTP
jgi:predicted chitinase